MKDSRLFVEYEEYSQGRYYGTLISDYTKGNNVAVLTPNGFRQLKKNIQNLDDLLIVYVEASLGNRMIRYINRCGVNSFNFDDKNEICSRVERDFGMFLGIKDEVNLVVDGNEEICKSVEKIMNKYNEIYKEENA